MSIRQKMLTWLLLIAVVVVFSNSFFLYKHWREAENAAIEDAESTARALALGLSFADEARGFSPMYKTPAKVQNYIEHIHNKLKEDIVMVDDKKKIVGDAVPEDVGKIFDHDKNNEVGQTIRDGLTRTFIERSSDFAAGFGRLVVVQVKSDEGEPIGALILEYTSYYDKYRAEVIYDLKTDLTISFIVLFMALVIGYFMARNVTNPILRLKKASEEIASGNLDMKVEVESKDEIGDLAKAFNSMAEMRKKAEEKLREKEEEFRTLIENSQDVIQRFDRQLNRLYVNPVIERYTGIPYKEFLGKTDRELGLPEQNIVLWEKAAQTLLDTGNEQTVEFEFPTPQGNTYFETHLMPEFGPDGAVRFILIITRDITARKKAEKNLRLFKELLDKSNDAIFINDAETSRILDVNQRAQTNLGYTREELQGMRVTDIETVLTDESAWKEHMMELDKTGFMILEGRHKRKDGTIFPVEISVRNILIEGKNFNLAVARDITERKKAEDELKRLYEELQEKSEYLERFNRLVVGRELEMIKLKAEVNELLEKTGQPKKYEAPAEAEDVG